MPLIAEIVIDAAHIVIGSQRQADRPQVGLGVVLVAAQRVVFERHVLAPDLVHGGVQANSARIAGAGRAGCRLISHAVHGYCRWTQIVRLVNAVGIGDLDDAGSHQGRRHGLRVELRVGEPQSFVVEEEVPLAAQERLGGERASDGGSEARAVVLRKVHRGIRQREAAEGERSVIGAPAIGLPDGVVVVKNVTRAMILVRPAFGGHLHLGSDRNC